MEFAFEYIKFEMAIRYLIKTVKEAVGYVSLGFREGVGIGYVHLGILVFIAVNLDTTT